jgi:hypothetical protein
MKQRGRVSSDAHATAAIVNVDGTPLRLEPPASLSDAERVVFANLVASCDPDHFRLSDAPLLCRYAEAVVLAEKASQQLRRHGAVTKNGRVSGWITVPGEGGAGLGQPVDAFAVVTTGAARCEEARPSGRCAPKRIRHAVGVGL